MREQRPRVEERTVIFENSFEYITNQSNEVFNNEEMNKGLKFVIKPSRPPMDELIVGIESSIQFKMMSSKLL